MNVSKKTPNNINLNSMIIFLSLVNVLLLPYAFNLRGMAYSSILELRYVDSFLVVWHLVIIFLYFREQSFVLERSIETRMAIHAAFTASVIFIGIFAIILFYTNKKLTEPEMKSKSPPAQAFVGKQDDTLAKSLGGSFNGVTVYALPTSPLGKDADEPKRYGEMVATIGLILALAIGILHKLTSEAKDQVKEAKEHFNETKAEIKEFKEVLELQVKIGKAEFALIRLALASRIVTLLDEYEIDRDKYYQERQALFRVKELLRWCDTLGKPVVDLVKVSAGLDRVFQILKALLETPPEDRENSSSNAVGLQRGCVDDRFREFLRDDVSAYLVALQESLTDPRFQSETGAKLFDQIGALHHLVKHA